MSPRRAGGRARGYWCSLLALAAFAALAAGLLACLFPTELRVAWDWLRQLPQSFP